MGKYKGKSGSRNSPTAAKEEGFLGNPATAGHPNNSMSRQEAIDYIQSMTGVSETEAEEMYDACRTFTGSGYSAIRDAQEKGNTNSDYYQYGEKLENMIQKGSKYYNQGALYRGIDVDNATADNIINTLKNGGAISMRGTSSWSSSETIARDIFAYAKYNKDSYTNKSIVFVLDNGTKAGTSVKSWSKYSVEDEVLVSKRARFTATKITTDPTYSHYVVHLSEYLG